MKILIVVDAQNDFISGKLGSYSAQCKVPAIREKIQKLPKETVIIFTQDYHTGESYTPERTIEASLIPIHCDPSTEGFKIEKGILKDAYERVGIQNTCRYLKDKPGYPNWAYAIEDIEKTYGENISEIEIIGFCTDICVVTNFILLRTLLPATPIVVDADCCAGTTWEAHVAALNVIKSCMGVVINEH